MLELLKSLKIICGKKFTLKNASILAIDKYRYDCDELSLEVTCTSIKFFAIKYTL